MDDEGFGGSNDSFGGSSDDEHGTSGNYDTGQGYGRGPNDFGQGFGGGPGGGYGSGYGTSPEGHLYPGAPPPQSGGVLKYVAGIGCGCLGLIAVAGAALVIWAASLPDAGPVAGSRLKETSKTYLGEQGLLEPGEKVIYYNDESIYMDDSEICFFTNRKMARHEKDGPTVVIPWTRVEDVSFGEEILSTVVNVRSDESEIISCEITVGGEKFKMALDSYWRKLNAEGEEDIE